MIVYKLPFSTTIRGSFSIKCYRCGDSDGGGCGGMGGQGCRPGGVREGSHANLQGYPLIYFKRL